MPTKCWPCKSNSVCLGSSPRASKRVGAFGLSAGVLAAGPVQRVYSSELPLRVFARPGWLGLLTEPEPLTDLRHQAGHGQTLRFLQSRRASAAPHPAALLRFQPRNRSQAAVGLGPLHRQREQRSAQISDRVIQESLSPPYSRGRRRALLPTGTCRSLRDSLRFSALSPSLRRYDRDRRDDLIP